MHKLGASYFCLANEIGEKCGTYHMHIFAFFMHGMKWDRMKQYFEQAHIDVCKGNGQENIDYVRKAGKHAEKVKTQVENSFIEYGFLPESVRHKHSYTSDWRRNSDKFEDILKGIDTIITLLSTKLHDDFTCK